MKLIAASVFLGRSIAVLFFMVLDFVTCVTIGHVDVQTVHLHVLKRFVCSHRGAACPKVDSIQPDIRVYRYGRSMKHRGGILVWRK